MSVQSSLGLAGFHVTLVPETQAAFYGSYLENPSTSKRDVWDLATPGWIPDWFGNNGRSTLEPLFTVPGNGSQRLRWLQRPQNRCPNQQGTCGTERGCRWLVVVASRTPDHERRRRCPRRVPEVARVPLLGRARVHLLVVRPQLRPDQCLAVIVTVAGTD